MFIGHLALGLAAKRATPRVSLAVLFSAAQFADMLWPVLVALGIEQVRIHPGDTAFTPLEFVSYPYSHSLLLAIWGLVFGLVYERAAHARHQAKAGGPFFSRTVVIITALVVSHWVLDVVTHRPDMPLYPGSVRIGLGLWNSVPGTIAIEVAMYGAGLWVYFSSTQARDGIGLWGGVSLFAFLLLAYVANVAGPPPPSVTALWVTAILATVLLTWWSWWVDRHRDAILS